MPGYKLYIPFVDVLNPPYYMLEPIMRAGVPSDWSASFFFEGARILRTSGVSEGMVESS